MAALAARIAGLGMGGSHRAPCDPAGADGPHCSLTLRLHVVLCARSVSWQHQIMLSITILQKIARDGNALVRGADQGKRGVAQGEPRCTAPAVDVGSPRLSSRGDVGRCTAGVPQQVTRQAVSVGSGHRPDGIDAIDGLHSWKARINRLPLRHARRVRNFISSDPTHGCRTPTGARKKPRRRPQSNSIHTGAWSLDFSQPRTSRSTAPARSRGTSDGLNRKWSIRKPALRWNAFRK